MRILSQVVLVIHVMSAMLWFGGMAFLPRGVREALAADRGEARRRMASLLRQGGMFGGVAALMIVTGVLLASLWPGGLGGFHSPFAVPVRFHIGLTLAIIWWAFGFLALRPTMERLVAVANSDAPLESGAPLAKRMSMFAGISHLLFTVIVVLMLWRL